MVVVVVAVVEVVLDELVTWPTWNNYRYKAYSAGMMAPKVLEAKGVVPTKAYTVPWTFVVARTDSDGSSLARATHDVNPVTTAVVAVKPDVDVEPGIDAALEPSNVELPPGSRW